MQTTGSQRHRLAEPRRRDPVSVEQGDRLDGLTLRALRPDDEGAVALGIAGRTTRRTHCAVTPLKYAAQGPARSSGKRSSVHCSLPPFGRSRRRREAPGLGLAVTRLGPGKCQSLMLRADIHRSDLGRAVEVSLNLVGPVREIDQ